MNFNSKRSVTDEQNERHKRILASILKEEGNKSCADCKTRNPTWASVNLGVFVCLTCSGIHRSLGVHISQVRSCNLDTWLPKQVEFCRVMGNIKGNRYWEARLPKDFRRPPSGNPNPELAAFIRAKYVDRAYAATDAPPPTIDNYQDHKYAAVDDSAAPAAPASAAATTALSLSSGQSIRLTPSKASASSPALTVDLLGGFDDVRTNPGPVLLPPTPPSNGGANSDPFSYGSFVSASAPAPPPAPTTGSSSIQRNSLEWSDFCAAAPAAGASAAAQSGQLPSASSHLLQTQSSAHHRSYSNPELAPNGSGLASSQPSRLAHGQAFSAAHDPHRQQQQQHTRTASQPPNGFDLLYGHHSDGHQAPSQPHRQGQAHPSLASAPPLGAASAPAAADPFAPQLTPADDLLAGLTIHHIMESLAAPTAEDNGITAAASTGGAAGPHQSAAAAATSDPFQFSSSAQPGDPSGKQLPRGPSHKRHPSGVKSSEEILRLFDTESSTAAKAATAAAAAGTGGLVAANGGGGLGSGGASGAFDDPFGDFLGAGTISPAGGRPPSATVIVTETGGSGMGGGAFPGHKAHGGGVCEPVSFGLTTSCMVPNLL